VRGASLVWGGRRVSWEAGETARGAHQVDAVDVFPPLVVVAVAETGILVGRVGGAARKVGGQRAAAVGVDEAAEVVVLLLEAGDLLLELADFDERGREGGDLLGGVAEGGLELGDGLLELLDVRLALCAVAGLGLCVTAALRALDRMCRMAGDRRGHDVRRARGGRAYKAPRVCPAPCLAAFLIGDQSTARRFPRPPRCGVSHGSYPIGLSGTVLLLSPRPSRPRNTRLCPRRASTVSCCSI
jgi:hypothetical protein